MEREMLIKWMTGVTTIRHEQRVEDDAIVFGSYINGVWNESCRMVFGGDKGAKAMGLAALAQVQQKAPAG